MQINKAIDKFENLVFITNKCINYIAMFVLAFTMFLVSGDILGRIFNRPIFGTYELTSLGLGLMVFLSIGLTFLRGGHVSITFIVDRFPVRVQAILDTILYFIFAIMIFILTWQLGAHIVRSYVSGEVTADLTIPMYLFVILATVGSFFFLLAVLLKLIKSIVKAVTKNES